MMLNPYEAPKTNPQPRKEGYCSFCQCDYRVVGPLVEGPDLAYVCGTCCDQVRERFATDMSVMGEAGKCGFCSQDSSLVGSLFAASNGVLICEECAGIARSILDQEAKRKTERKRRR